MSKKLLHRSLYAIIVVISYLPLRILYLLATTCYYLLYYVLKYRRNVVTQNISIAFPELNTVEKEKIIKAFYMDFCEHFFETIKLLTISEKKLHSMFDADYSAIDMLNKEGRSCYILLGHQFNWEMLNAHMTSINKTRTIIAYLPVPSGFFDGLLLKIRTRFGAILTASDKLMRGLFPYRNETYNLALMADQNPAVLSKAYWLPFFGYSIPFFKGPEKGAKAGNNPVVFVDVEKIKRGKYKVHSYLLAARPKDIPESVITEKYIEKLQESIRRSPGSYLWSHRRWRHAQENHIVKSFETSATG
jgi:KDO2-lipid IV(A) lauroyltransferase